MISIFICESEGLLPLFLYTGSGATNQLMDADHVGIIHGSLTRLFENAKFLDDAAFIAFTTALCRLSAEASGLPIGEEEPSSANKSARAVSQMHFSNDKCDD